MKKILAFSILILLFLTLNTKTYAEVNSDGVLYKVEEINIERHHHLDIGFSGASLQGRYSYDLTSYNELGFKTSYGLTLNANSTSYLMDTGVDLSLEDKAYFIKSSKYYSKNKSVVTQGSYIKTFAGITNSLSVKGNPFLVVGTGIGYDILNNNIGFGIGVDLASTLQINTNRYSLGGIFFIRPELNFKLLF